MLFNYRLLKLFLKTYGKDEIDNMVPSHNYDIRKKSLKYIQATTAEARGSCCALVSIVQQVPVGRLGRLRVRPPTGLAECLWAHGIQ